MNEQLKESLDQFQSEVAEGMKKPGTRYTPTNMMLALVHKIGNIANFGKKRRLAEHSIGQDDVDEGNRLVKIEIGQAMWLLAGICEANGFTLAECRQMAEKHVEEKQD